MNTGPIVTRRLILRTPKMSDARSIFESYATDAEVTRYLPWQPHKRVRETREFLKVCAARRKSGREFQWAITLKGKDRVIGMVACRPEGHKANIGYVLGRAHWKRGLMTEAVRAVVARALEAPEIYRVWATCDVDNIGSARVLEKCGMRREGILRGWIMHPHVSPVPRDSYAYALIRPRSEC